MNTATGTIKENLSDDERANRRRGMKLVARDHRSTPFRIAMSQDLADSFLDSASEPPSGKRSEGSLIDETAGSFEQDSSSPGDSKAMSRTVPIAVTLTAVALTGVMIGYLLKRGRD